MKLFIITSAYCRSAQLARMFLEFRRVHLPCPVTHVVVQGHYPIDKDRNNKEIELIVNSYGNAGLLDPGQNLGSSQSQMWALNQLRFEADDYWVNLDPDSAVVGDSWLCDMKKVLDGDSECVVISSNAPMVEALRLSRLDEFQTKTINGVKIGILTRPTPFNLSMWKCSFIKEMGGFQQMGIWWGELEAIIHHNAVTRGKYHAYLLDHMENEDGKFFHPVTNSEWKDRHMRTTGPEQFPGNYEDFLNYYYPDLIKLKL